MKVFIIAILFTLPVFAQDSFFNENYPSFEDYQTQSIQGLKNYFYAFISRCLITKGENNLYRLDFQNDSTQNVLTIFSQIKREQKDNHLNETLIYIFPDGNRFEYTLVKNGTSNATPDMDLLKFNFKNGRTKLNLTSLQTWFDSTDSESSMAYIGLMEVTVKVETYLRKDGGERYYVYFYKDMPNPQSMLSVTALLKDETLQYIHSSRGMEIAPKIFFQGLREGASIFSDFSIMSLMLIKMYGFPSIKGIN